MGSKMRPTESQYLAKRPVMTSTTFPRLKSAGVQGAKVVGRSQMVEVTVKTTNGHSLTPSAPPKARPSASPKTGGNIERGTSLPKR